MITKPPEFSSVANQKLNQLIDQGFQVNGLALYRAGERILIDHLGYVTRISNHENRK